MLSSSSRIMMRSLRRSRVATRLGRTPFDVTSSRTTRTFLSSLFNLPKPEKGTGFDNFLKGEEDTKESKGDSKQQQGNGGGGGNNNNFDWNSVLLLVGIAVSTAMVWRTPDDNESARSRPLHAMEITHPDFWKLVLQKKVAKVVVDSQENRARVYLRRVPKNEEDVFDQDSSTFDNTTTTTPPTTLPATPYYRLSLGEAGITAFEHKLEEAQKALKLKEIPVQYTTVDPSLGRELVASVPTLVLAATIYGVLRLVATRGGPFGGGGGSGGGGNGRGIFQIGKSTAKKIAKEDVNVTFANVAGCDEAKKEIMEFVDFLKDSEPFTKLGAKIPKGALLCGPPGTGKTLLAKAVAGEAGVPFYTISGSDFIEMFVGVGPSRVRDLFSEARQNAPCIIFIDEIDAVGRQRGRGGMGGNDERENTLNQLLVEMDGFETKTGIVVLAGTNRVDILDQALTRPGRFDRQITVDKPDLKGRQAIFKVHLEGIKLEDEIDDIAGRLAGLTPGFAGADIANICNEAAIVAARRKGQTVNLEDFEKATDRIIGGLESNKIMSKEERSIVAHHEAGHAVAGWFLEHADPLLKVTIIPRSSGALGFAQYLPKEVMLRTQEQIMDIVCMALAGRAAEDIMFGRVTTGASDDLKRVTEMVYSTIRLYGMNERLGQLSFPKDPNAFYDERPYSEKTAKAMDEEARAIVDAAYERTLNLLKEKKTELEAVAKMLLEKETITHDDIRETIGDRPFAGDPAYQEFVERRRQDKEKEANEAAQEEKEQSEPGLQDGTLTPGLAFRSLQ